MTIIAWAIIIGAFMGGCGVWMIFMANANGREDQVSEEWIKDNIYTGGKQG